MVKSLAAVAILALIAASMPSESSDKLWDVVVVARFHRHTHTHTHTHTRIFVPIPLLILVIRFLLVELCVHSRSLCSLYNRCRTG